MLGGSRKEAVWRGAGGRGLEAPQQRGHVCDLQESISAEQGQKPDRGQLGGSGRRGNGGIRWGQPSLQVWEKREKIGCSPRGHQGPANI